MRKFQQKITIFINFDIKRNNRIKIWCKNNEKTIDLLPEIETLCEKLKVYSENKEQLRLLLLSGEIKLENNTIENIRWREEYKLENKLNQICAIINVLLLGSIIVLDVLFNLRVVAEKLEPQIDKESFKYMFVYGFLLTIIKVLPMFIILRKLTIKLDKTIKTYAKKKAEERVNIWYNQKKKGV